MGRITSSVTSYGIACALLIQGAFAQEDKATFLAYAAGYKAAFTCSAIFNARKTLDQIAAHELTGVSAVYADHFAVLPDAIIDHDNKRVSVAYDGSLPPRVSQWRKHLGCVQLPAGATLDVIPHLPKVEIEAAIDATTDNGAPWTAHAPVNGSSGNAMLDVIVKNAFAKPNYGADQFTTAVLIATPGKIIAERYLDGYTPTTSQRTWSVAKSIGASVIGAAVQQDIVDVNAPAGLAQWSDPLDPRGDITLQNILHMASGLDSNQAGNHTPRLYFGGGKVSDTTIPNGLEAAPGKRWKYANNDTLLAVRTLYEAMNDKDAYLRFPFENLLYKIGMTHTKLETDWEGNFILSSQVWTTSRDMARLGILHLQGGVWDGERILPEGWASYVANPAPAQPDSADRGYGAQWWLFNKRAPEVPADTYAASGNRGQSLVIIPSRNLLIVRRGYDPAIGERFRIQDFVADVLRALE